MRVTHTTDSKCEENHVEVLALEHQWVALLCSIVTCTRLVVEQKKNHILLHIKICWDLCAEVTLHVTYTDAYPDEAPEWVLEEGTMCIGKRSVKWFGSAWFLQRIFNLLFLISFSLNFCTKNHDLSLLSESDPWLIFIEFIALFTLLFF